MLLRLLFLISLLGYTSGPDAREGSPRKMGGERMGMIVNIFVIIGTIVLLALIVLGVMSITGAFDSELMDPVT